MSDKPVFVQRHHRQYDPEIIEKIFKGEHYLLSLMDRYTKRRVSMGFLRSLEYFIKDNKDRAIELE